jgi:glycosyltransferase involved in cell wall biosynthesis
LEDMTVSMLLGEQGDQKEELDHMVNWIADHCNPDIIHISNALLLGLARRLKEKIKVPVVCTLQDEDVWIDPMKPQFQERIWKLMNERSKDVDVLVSVSDFFAGKMRDRMKLPADRIQTIHLGVDIEDYHFVSIREKPRNVGYISRMCHKDGFDIVVDAFIKLKKKRGFEDVKLIATGGSTGDDSKFNKEQKRKLKENNLLDDFEIINDFEGQEVNDFFRKVQMITVPVRIGEAFGMYMIEAMASGVPVVQPELGAFPEIIELSGGGVTYKPNTPEKLSETWAELLNDPDRLEKLSIAGYEGTREKFDIHSHTKEIITLYESLSHAERSRSMTN